MKNNLITCISLKLATGYEPKLNFMKTELKLVMTKNANILKLDY